MNSLASKMNELPEIEHSGDQKSMYDKIVSDNNLYAMMNQEELSKQVYEYGVKNKLEGNFLLSLNSQHEYF